MSNTSSDSCTIVIFGASGDLTQRKLIPAIFDLYQTGGLPQQFAVVGVARTELTDDGVDLPRPHQAETRTTHPGHANPDGCMRAEQRAGCVRSTQRDRCGEAVRRSEWTPPASPIPATSA